MTKSSFRNQNKSLPSRLWYGWVVLVVVFIVMGSLIGFRTSFGVFFKVLTAEFGWSRAETSGAFSMGMLGYAISAPIVGWLLDKWSIRWTMSVGLVLFGIGMGMGYFVNELWHIYLMNFLLSVGFGCSAHLPQVQVISNWFVRRRGLAVGLTSSAQGIAFATSVITSTLISWLGWRVTYLVFSGSIILFVLPIVGILVRDHPRDVHTVADAPFLKEGERTANYSAIHSSRRGVTSAPATLGGLVFSLRFLVLYGLFASIAYIFTSFVVHLVPLATDYGFSPSSGAGVFALFGASVFLGTLLSGYSDQIGRTITYVIGSILGTIACLLLALIVPLVMDKQIIFGSFLAGIALGISRPTIAAMLADQFSGPVFGRVNGTMMTLFSLVGAVGPFITGYLFDLFGRYQESILIIGAIFLASMFFAIALERMKRPHDGFA